MTDDFVEDGLYVAGHVAPAGRYRRVEPPSGREVVLDRSGVLPASLDGRVAVYRRFEPRRAAAGDPPATSRRRSLSAID
jgi:hypothetical protein